MKNLIIVFTILSVLISCNKTKEVNSSENLSAINDSSKESILKGNQGQSEAYTLFKNTCYACHSVTSKSHDAIIAPPMVAVKKRYLMTYPEKEDFIKAIVNFTSDPTEEKAMMFGAVQQFNVMLKQEFKEEDLKKIATYIYDNSIEKPGWFDAHFEDEHGGKMGGRRRGRRNQN